MKQKLEQRLQSLKAEFEAGQKMLADLEAKQANLRETLLRISGAIQVLEEELNNASEVVDDNHHQPPETVNTEVVTTAGDTNL
jgi:predicted nuclease with TOPRIM domain